MGNTKTAIDSSDNTTTGHNKMYASQNFKTKKQLKDAIAAGRKVTVWQPGPFGGNVPENGTVCLEGPHYPEPHKWYARATLESGYIVKVQ
ncbi:MAG TPA: hypothetical protein V6C65_07750 [Allocoleopsis sp.]